MAKKRKKLKSLKLQESLKHQQNVQQLRTWKGREPYWRKKKGTVAQGYGTVKKTLMKPDLLKEVLREQSMKKYLNIRTNCSSSGNKWNYAILQQKRSGSQVKKHPSAKSTLLCFNSSINRRNSPVVLQSCFSLCNSSSDTFQWEFDQHWYIWDWSLSRPPTYKIIFVHAVHLQLSWISGKQGATT